jgi:hypothetical protein
MTPLTLQASENELGLVENLRKIIVFMKIEALSLGNILNFHLGEDEQMTFFLTLVFFYV